MNYLSTALVITVLVIVVHQGNGVAAYDDGRVDQIAEEAKNRAVTIIDGPKYVEPPRSVDVLLNTSNPAPNTNNNNSNVNVQHPNNTKPEQRPPSKPPITPDKPGKQIYFPKMPRPTYYAHIQKIPQPRHHHQPPFKYYHSPNSIYKFPRVIPLPPHLRNHYYLKSQPLMFAASTGKPSIVKSPKFSLPVQTINGIRTEFVRPPKFWNITSTTTTTTTTTEATTTTKALRTKRIWPKRTSELDNSTLSNATVLDNSSLSNSSNEDYLETSATFRRFRYAYKNATTTSTTQSPTLRSYRPVTRIPKIKSTTPTINFTAIGPNDWVPIVPSHFPKLRTLLAPIPTPINKRSDFITNSETPPEKQMMYLQSFGLVPVSKNSETAMTRKKMVFFKRKRQLNPYYSGYSPRPGKPLKGVIYGDQETDESHSHPRVVTKIKHHHHHHHHRYIKTVEKPVKVPYKVEIPKPYPVTVEKKVPYPVEKIKFVDKPVPYPVTVEKRIPYPIGIKVPHPVPVKVVEKEYVPKPYPIVHHVPVVKHVQVKVPHPVPVPVEKKVPYPVEVKVPVDRPVPVRVTVEKKVPYPVPVKVLVPQPYPVETKVPYPVEVKVKEPVEVIRHVPVKVPVPQPYPVKVPVRVTVEKKVPYPVEVEKKIPVPVEVYIPQKVEVEKKIPVYVPKPYPVEKKVPVPVKVPYPVKVPVQVPIEVPIYIHHPYQIESADYISNVQQYDPQNVGQYFSNIASQFFSNTNKGEQRIFGTISAEVSTNSPQHTVTAHGNSGFAGFHSRSGTDTLTTTAATTI
uniref:Cuticle protein n=1 Tax=Bombyx mori TaxID=7091 RepID=A0A8R2C4V1_BOMMO|nr:titin [Bombyx mori]